MRPSFDHIYMRLAHAIAKRSSCARLKVGCVITDQSRNRVLSIGYNGNYKGGPNECDCTEPGLCGCIHAEDNACIKLDFTEPSKIAYVTTLPCKMCVKRLINAGVQAIIYDKEYRSDESKKILFEAGIEFRQLSMGSSHLNSRSTRGL